MPATKPSYKYLPIFLIISLLVMGFGGLFIPGPWYESLNKAPWTPPNLAFPIVWAFLYLFIAISGWQLFAQNNASLKLLWGTQLAVNTIWSWIFFGQHWVLAGLINLVILDILVILLTLKCHQSKLNMSTVLMLPYIGWLLIATSLNIYIYIYN